MWYQDPRREEVMPQLCDRFEHSMRTRPWSDKSPITESIVEVREGEKEVRSPESVVLARAGRLWMLGVLLLADDGASFVVLKINDGWYTMLVTLYLHGHCEPMGPASARPRPTCFTRLSLNAYPGKCVGCDAGPCLRALGR